MRLTLLRDLGLPAEVSVFAAANPRQENLAMKAVRTFIASLLLVPTAAGLNISLADERPTTAELPAFAVPFPDSSKPAAGYRVLSRVEHFPVFHATKEIGTYSHHAQLAYRDGTFYAAWSNHKEREDGPGQRVFASLSTNGRSWREAFELFPAQGPTEPADKQSIRVLTALAWVVVDEQIYAVAEVNGHGRVARSVSADGGLGPIFWLVAEPPAVVAGHQTYPASTDPRFSQIATRIVDYLAEPMNLPSWDFYSNEERLKVIGFSKQAPDGHRMCEPTTYRRPDGVYVRLYEMGRIRTASTPRSAATTAKRGHSPCRPIFRTVHRAVLLATCPMDVAT